MQITSKNVKMMYPNDSEQLQCYMEIIIEDLESQYDEIPKYLIFTLDMMADLLRVYFKAIRELNGARLVTTSDNGVRSYVNPAVNIMEQTHRQIIALAKEMGLTMFSKKKMKLLNKKVGEDDELTAEEYLSQLTQ